MLRQDIIGIIETTLYINNGIEKAVSVSEYNYLANQISRNLSENPEFRKLNTETLKEAMGSLNKEPSYDTIMAAIRRKYAEFLKSEKTNENSAPIPEGQEDLPNWGNFFKCRYCWEKDGHIGKVPDMTTSYTAKWILEQKKFISEGQVQWCRDAAKEDADKCPNAEKREQCERLSFEEAVVCITMQNFDKYLKEEKAESCRQFLDSKRNSYKEYFISRYGHEPDFSPINKTVKPPRCSALAKTKHDNA